MERIYSGNDTELEDVGDIEAYVSTLDFKLRKWAVQFNITLMALTFLLKILKAYGHISLPQDARTLLKTPRTVKTTTIGSGRMWYRDLKQKLSEICKLKKWTDALELELHIDGLPLYRSPIYEFWPIQCSIKGLIMKPFLVGLHYSVGKPESLELFLRLLLNDLRDLLQLQLMELRKFLLLLWTK